MPRAIDITVETSKLNFLIIGEPFVGKTRLLKTFPGTVYVFDFDDGTKILMGAERIYYDTILETDIKRPAAFKRANMQLDAFEKCAREKGIVEYVEGDETIKIDLIAIDGSTELLSIIMNQVLFINGRPGTMPQQNDWGPQTTAYTNFINRVKALPCHVVVICHEHIIEDQNEGMKMVPAITGKLATKIGAKFDAVFRMESKRKGREVNYQMLTRNLGIYQAGHRFEDALELYEKPDLGMVIEKLKNYQERKKGGR